MASMPATGHLIHPSGATTVPQHHRTKHVALPPRRTSYSQIAPTTDATQSHRVVACSATSATSHLPHVSQQLSGYNTAPARLNSTPPPPSQPRRMSVQGASDNPAKIVGSSLVAAGAATRCRRIVGQPTRRGSYNGNLGRKSARVSEASGSSSSNSVPCGAHLTESLPSPPS
ncbi:hypothetical protein DOTSEDRAFT_38314 [Dothistroma septosporum NZE10]|uniref:Uncharacterized protein n=1 Tax=Dothistroma septosporum (strain NZE10 / CBS 128990) TaxID=675120 RepID=N1PE26_DOTSN|nr:hypothetical protein DOTSEDRAFT_38314 [Dothistroma septosporum NZE10]